MAREIVDTVQRPPVAPDSDTRVRPGLMEAGDIVGYETVRRAPTHTTYRGLDVYSMAPVSRPCLHAAPTEDHPISNPVRSVRPLDR